MVDEEADDEPRDAGRKAVEQREVPTVGAEERVAVREQEGADPDEFGGVEADEYVTQRRREQPIPGGHVRLEQVHALDRAAVLRCVGRVRIWTAARRLNRCQGVEPPMGGLLVAQVLAIGGRDLNLGSHAGLDGLVRHKTDEHPRRSSGSNRTH